MLMGPWLIVLLGDVCVNRGSTQSTVLLIISLLSYWYLTNQSEVGEFLSNFWERICHCCSHHHTKQPFLVAVDCWQIHKELFWPVKYCIRIFLAEGRNCLKFLFCWPLHDNNNNDVFCKIISRTLQREKHIKCGIWSCNTWIVLVTSMVYKEKMRYDVCHKVNCPETQHIKQNTDFSWATLINEPNFCQNYTKINLLK